MSEKNEIKNLKHTINLLIARSDLIKEEYYKMGAEQERERVLGEILKALPEAYIIPDHRCYNLSGGMCEYSIQERYNDCLSEIKNIISKL